MFVIITQRRRCPVDSQIFSIDTSTPTLGTRLSGEHGPLSRRHTHLLILAMVVSATRTKSSSGESCTPLGNRNWSSNTFTSLVSVSYSSRLWVPTAKGHTGSPHPPCWVGAWLTSGQGPAERDSASHWSDKALVVPCSDLVPG